MFSVVYHPEAREEATALPLKIRVKFDRLIGKLEYDARLLREPDTKATLSLCSGFSSKSHRKRQRKKSISPESG